MLVLPLMMMDSVSRPKQVPCTCRDEAGRCQALSGGLPRRVAVRLASTWGAAGRCAPGSEQTLLGSTEMDVFTTGKHLALRCHSERCPHRHPQHCCDRCSQLSCMQQCMRQCTARTHSP
jgi:hypothetical protein